MSNESKQVAGYVPSAEAVERAALEIWGRQGISTAWEHLVPAYQQPYRDLATAALSAAVPVEVARLLGEVRALADELTADRRNGRNIERSPFEEGYGEGHYDARVEAGRKLRAVLDTVGAPVQVEPWNVEAFTDEMHKHLNVSRRDLDVAVARSVSRLTKPAKVDKHDPRCISRRDIENNVQCDCNIWRAIDEPTQVDEAATGGQQVVICQPDPTCKDPNINRWHCMRGHSLGSETPTPGVCPLPVCERRGANATGGQS